MLVVKGPPLPRQLPGQGHELSLLAPRLALPLHHSCLVHYSPIILLKARVSQSPSGRSPAPQLSSGPGLPVPLSPPQPPLPPSPPGPRAPATACELAFSRGPSLPWTMPPPLPLGRSPASREPLVRPSSPRTCIPRGPVLESPLFPVSLPPPSRSVLFVDTSLTSRQPIKGEHCQQSSLPFLPT